jgi:HEAT repeat protein
LARIEQPAAAAALRRALDDEDPWVRYFAARGVAEHRDQDAVVALTDRARHDSAAHVRIAAIDALGALRARDRVADLKALAADPHDEVAAAALGALGCIAAAAGLPELLEALRSDSAPRRAAAVRALAAHRSTDAVSSLEWTAAADPDPAVARAAIEGLAAIAAGENGSGQRAAVDAMLLLLSDTSRRDAAATALAQLPASRIPDIARGLQHPQAEVRGGTVDALGRCQRPEASRFIVDALDDTSALVREAAVVTLTRLGVRGLESRFTELAARDQSRVVRRAATTALARLRT